MAIRYVVKNKKGDYFGDRDRVGNNIFTKDINKAAIFNERFILGDDAKSLKIVKVDVCITELE
jgi:hypothetical protein